MGLNGKQKIVGTAFGRAVMRARSAFELISCARENLGTVANDQLAEYIVCRLPERHFVDVGAHIGSIVAAVHNYCPSVRVTAVEPIPSKAKHLAARFPHVSVVDCALSDHTGKTEFFINPEASGYSSLASHNGAYLEIAVEVNRLDRIVLDPDVIKIDVEGAELGVLRGSEGITSRPVIMFESGPEQVLGYRKSDLWGWFDQHDYALFVPNRLAHKAPGMTLELFLDSHEYPRRTTNYFGVPLEKVETVRQKARGILKIN